LPSTATRTRRPPLPAATRPSSSRYCIPWAAVIPPTAAYGEPKTNTGTENSSAITYITVNPAGRGRRQQRPAFSGPRRHHAGAGRGERDHAEILLGEVQELPADERQQQPGEAGGRQQRGGQRA